jgi:hypothetical protein
VHIYTNYLLACEDEVVVDQLISHSIPNQNKKRELKDD